MKGPSRAQIVAQKYGPTKDDKKNQNEKCGQGMLAKSHLEAYVSKQDFPNLGTLSGSARHCRALPDIVRPCLTVLGNA